MPEIISSPFSYQYSPPDSIQCCHAFADKTCTVLGGKCGFFHEKFTASGNVLSCMHTAEISKRQKDLVHVECLRMVRSGHSSRSIGTHIHYLPCQCSRPRDISTNKQEDTLWHFDKQEGKIIHRECGRVIFE